MAGSLYLGSQRVCPAIVVGGSEPVETPNTLFKLGDNITTVSTSSAYYNLFSSKKSMDKIDLDLNNVEVVSGTSAFAGILDDNYYGGSVTIKKLRVVSGNTAFQSAFYGNQDPDNPLTLNVDFSTIEELSGEQCFNLTFAFSEFNEDISFDRLSVLTGSGALNGCFIFLKNTDLYFSSLNSQSFGSYTNQFTNMLRFGSGCTVHFPSNLQSVIGSWSDVLNGFGGTNTTVLFDLPATE